MMGQTHHHWIWSWALLPLLLSCFLLAAVQVAQPPSATSLKPKIFVLGLSKTGTTSIGDAFERLGYRRLGWKDIRSRHMVHTWANGDIAPLVELTKHYEAFEDLPWPFVYREMAEMYPNSRFILSLRKDEETWLRSMRAHVGRGRWIPYTYFYGADTMDGNEHIILDSYRNHTQNVREYFKDKPHRFIELNIDNGDMNWDILCGVAQCPGGGAPSAGFPRSNSVASWDMGFALNWLHWLWGWALTRTEEQTSYYYYASGRTLLKPLLSFGWSVCDLVDRFWSELYFRYYKPMFLPPLNATGRLS